jgi:hypothetical protein
MLRVAFSLLTTAVLATAATGPMACSSVQNTRIGVLTPDDSKANWYPVADVLARRCGTLDCHGQIGRNFRIWSGCGMRLAADASADCGRTTPAEYEATFRSLVDLEPQVMSTVVAGQGEHPELLTFIRKARGTEAHKGGAIDSPGDDTDSCMTSWLTTSSGGADGGSGQTDTMACTHAMGLPMFPTSDASAE